MIIEISSSRLLHWQRTGKYGPDLPPDGGLAEQGPPVVLFQVSGAD
jgi:hypothetical protein